MNHTRSCRKTNVTGDEKDHADLAVLECEELGVVKWEGHRWV